MDRKVFASTPILKGPVKPMKIKGNFEDPPLMRSLTMKGLRQHFCHFLQWVFFSDEIPDNEGIETLSRYRRQLSP